MKVITKMICEIVFIVSNLGAASVGMKAIEARSKVQHTKCIIVVIGCRSQMSSTHLSHPPSLLQLQQQMSKCTDMRARIDTGAEE